MVNEQEILRAYNVYWNGYLTGDISAMEVMLDENYQQIGSAESEVFSNKTDALAFLHATIQEVAGKAEPRNRVMKVVPMGNFFLVNDLFDIYVLINDDWTFYSKFRASTLMEKRGNQWIFLHQHSSMPDMRASEGENLAIDAVATENLQLRDAVKRRTVELEQKNRELEIATSLERVRAAAMSMRQTKDLLAICDIMYKELTTLGFSEIRNAMINIHDDEDGSFLNYDSGQTITRFTYDVHPFIVKQVKAVRASSDAFSETFLEGTELDEFRQFRMSNGEDDDPRLDQTDTLAYYFYSIGTGSIGISTFGKISEEKKQVLRKFRNAFDFAYQRFRDLSLAEAQAQNAKIEAALERVRARALAMQEPEELIDVSRVLRKEMGLLGVEALETCSIYIHDDTLENAECWYALKDSSPEGTNLVSDHFLLNFNDTWVGREMLRFYQSPQEQVSIMMTGEPRREWIRYCEERSKPLQGVYGEVIPDRTYHLAKFSQGAIGAAAAGDISSESWNLLHRAAAVFSLAYSRFRDLTQARHDLIRLKEEKLRAENALTELKAAQAQLIQAEKMASLGELTAGIAHEIQNPLNFVNNFSEVSAELLDDMKTELEKGDVKESLAIAADIQQNLEKINHHGKRADAIVKGMLQHSRSGSGVKELINLNNLVDEYVRLAYHGLKAKDKTFNATITMELDQELGHVSIIPQDIGRVLLNIVNNAFYAVNEKKSQATEGYQPEVVIKTERFPNPKIGPTAVISIKDNGNGITKKIQDKIFQPFFTTKPTGFGTGLGLSLSYDIIRAHGGELKAFSSEEDGAIFIIQLPLQ